MWIASRLRRGYAILTRETEANALRARFVLLVAFVSGGVTLGAEISASRLLAPAFGTSLVVWAAIIGLMLVYLSAGYALGGRLADRQPRADLLYQIVALGGLLIGVVPLIAPPILVLGSGALGSGSLGLLLGAFLSLILLFAVPVTLLGMVSPFCIRLLVRDVGSSGAVAGRVYALSTVGSILGTFLPVLWLIPRFGTRNTFLAFGSVLLALAGLGLWAERRRGRAVLAIAGVALGTGATALPPRTLRALPPGAELLLETESPYNYIQVLREGPLVVLRLNEGQTHDSVYRVGGGLPGGPWDRLVMAPLLRETLDPRLPLRVAVLGGGAGTLAKSYGRVFPGAHVDLVEIDATLTGIGRSYFALDDPWTTIHLDDARNFLRSTDQHFDVIVLDAFRVPYVPFHLATREFFQLVHDRLTEQGVLAMNVLGTRDDRSLVNAVGSTVASIFPTVWQLDPLYFEIRGAPLLGNTVLYATRQPSRRAFWVQNLEHLEHSALARPASADAPRLRELRAEGPILTDDHSPVEEIVHGLILRLALAKP